jgi:hypothetical protein
MGFPHAVLRIRNEEPRLWSNFMKFDSDEFVRLTTLLESLKHLKNSGPREENLFQIGGRGHYENPTTQLLEFFLDASRGHGFGSTILDVLLETAHIEPGVIDTKLNYWTAHEVVTDEAQRKDRMDLIIGSESWVIVIENKIRHEAINDFGAYARFGQGKHKKFALILLSVRKEVPPQGWNSLNWSDLINAVRTRLKGTSIDAGHGKWLLFLREFLDNVENECSGGCKLDQELFDFSVKNSKALFQAQEVFQNFLNEIRIRWASSFQSLENVVVQESKIERIWQGNGGGGWRCIPIRFFLEQPAMEIVLKVFPSGKFGINLYPNSMVGVTLEQIKIHFIEPCRVEQEKGYLACIVADRDDLSFDVAYENVLSAIEFFQRRNPA